MGNLSLVNPWVIIGGLIGAITIFGLGYQRGTSNAQMVCDLKVAEIERKAKAQKELDEAFYYAKSLELEAARGKTRTFFRTVEKEVDKIVERPVYTNVCIDDDGMREINRALAGPTKNSSQPSDSVSNAYAVVGQGR